MTARGTVKSKKPGIRIKNRSRISFAVNPSKAYSIASWENFIPANKKVAPTNITAVKRLCSLK
jgi:hypothetical protein